MSFRGSDSDRGNLPVLRLYSYILPGDCTTGIPFGHHGPAALAMTDFFVQRYAGPPSHVIARSEATRRSPGTAFIFAHSTRRLPRPDGLAMTAFVGTWYAEPTSFVIARSEATRRSPGTAFVFAHSPRRLPRPHGLAMTDLFIPGDGDTNRKTLDSIHRPVRSSCHGTRI